MRAFQFHGGCLDEAALCFPEAPHPWLDLSTGINPVAWVPPPNLAVDLHALPSARSCTALEAAAGAAFRLQNAAIAALPGTEIGLRLLADVGLPSPFRYAAPGYRTHASALPGAAPCPAEAIEATSRGTLLLANPNNPDGRMLPAQALLDLASRLAAKGGVLVVDEAFTDATPEASLLPHLGSEDRVLVFRSFGKFFGLAGVRLGFVCGAAELVATLRARLGSWPLSATAIALGTAAYRDAAWIEATRAALEERRCRLDAVLHRHGLAPQGASPLFRLIETGDASALFTRLARQGILTRPFDYAPDWLRIGLPGDEAALERLDAALSHR